jgi:hypothetical protein
MDGSVTQLQDRILRAMSPEEKLRVSQGLREAAWLLKSAWIREHHPERSEAEIQAEVHRLFHESSA